MLNKKAVLLQGNRAMQHVFPTPNDSLIVASAYELRKGSRSLYNTGTHLSTKSRLNVKLIINK